MSSDFFLEEADAWRDEAWEMMRQRSDVKFFLLTKRPQRVKDCLPKDWGEGWEIPKEALYVPHYHENCSHCGSRLICNGCSDCGRCK